MNKEHPSTVLFRLVTGLAAGSPLFILAAMSAVLFRDAWPAWRYQGLSFFTGVTWNMGNQYANSPIVHHGVQAAPGAEFGILPFIVGTLGSSLIALVVAVPLSLLTAFALVYRLPVSVSRVISPFVELLAGIPSVVYGLWGVVVMAPFVENVLGPFLAHFGKIAPFLAEPVGTGLGLLTSGLVLAVMIIPIVTATARDLLAQVPRLPLEGGLALGMTGYESVRFIALPWARRGIIGAIILGWGRALGETMAVLMVSGNAANYLPTNIYSPISTMASTIASLLDAAFNDFTGLSVRALALIALCLMGIAVLTNLLANILVRIGIQDHRVEA